MPEPLLKLKEAQKDRSLHHIARVADRLGAYADYVLFGAYQEGIPKPSQIGYLVYVLAEDRLVFTQIIGIRSTEQLRSVAVDRLRHSLARYGLRRVVRRLHDGAFALGGVYTEELSDGALILAGSDEATDP